MIISYKPGMVVIKPRATITIEVKYLDWIDKQIEKKRFANRSHGFEYAVHKLMESEVLVLDEDILIKKMKLAEESVHSAWREKPPERGGPNLPNQKGW